LDKDGTMFDFTKTWAPFVSEVIQEASQGNVELAAQLAITLGFDSVASTFAPDSIVIADTLEIVVEAMLKLLPADSNKVQLVDAKTPGPQLHLKLRLHLFCLLFRRSRIWECKSGWSQTILSIPRSST